ncbi:hypothetical protein EF989_22960 [Salmonella enterica]|uniref:Uncharacterized protein n=10 Tax=Salmonella enterica TaxID=28901 RepID=A0A636VM76_SALER|nr:hypothetical protein [Salmonella enterica]ECB7304908.1 hypothetical protein [Salmonella enterica subsp. enterica serovar Yovokome]ECU9078165.1 hypothetical protein [Salmonella enterica subsp. enterica serovar O rough]ECZ3650427.1 hypothetical protein [Salmonella enterica subsp. enterica serovar Chailey]EDQ4688046.1 hypothetical protein [Salmonella enterica subsp. enterica serovar Stanleyville]MBJ5311933.1 hypothetical protein [Salmonella enterica subsp. enterica serovar Dabou]
MNKSGDGKKPNIRVDNALFNVIKYNKGESVFSDATGNQIFGCEWENIKNKISIYFHEGNEFKDAFSSVMKCKCDGENIEKYVTGLREIALKYLINENLLSWCKGQREMMLVLHTVMRRYKLMYSTPTISSFCFSTDVFDCEKGCVDKTAFLLALDEMSFYIDRECVQSEIMEAKRSWEVIQDMAENPLPFPEKTYSAKYKDDYFWAIKYIDKVYGKDIILHIDKINNACISDQLRVYHKYDIYFSTRKMNESELKLFVMRMKKTRSQNKYRESVKDKKVLNTYISSGAKARLTAMAKYHGMNINEELEQLINHAYTKYR